MAFHPYPQLIPSVFNLSGFAPPQPLTAASHWPWVDHPASGPGHATCHPIRIRFRYDYPTIGLTSRHAADSQAHSSKGTPSHTQGALTDCKRMVSGTLSLPSRGTFHHSLTVLSTIGHTEYLGLPGGPGRFTADSTSPLLLGKTQTTQPHTPSRTGLFTYSGAPSQMLPLICAHRACSRQPATFAPHNTAHATPARYHTHTV